MRWLWYRFGYVLTAFFFLFGFSLRIFGKQRVPQKGGLLIIANHQSYFDPPMVGLAMWRPIHYLARSTLFHFRFFAWLIDSLGAVPINQDSTGGDGIKLTLRLLRAGKAVLVFPEGARTSNGQVDELKAGIVAVLRRAKVPILPVGIAGAYHLWPIHNGAPRFAPLFKPDCGGIAVVVGEPIEPATLIHLRPRQILSILGGELKRLHGEAELLRRKA
jgi:1-acyl-sn-glycerol-3-phosphate acyltransferase